VTSMDEDYNVNNELRKEGKERRRKVSPMKKH
jgi:hypothetical protein